MPMQSPIIPEIKIGPKSAINAEIAPNRNELLPPLPTLAQTIS